MVDEGILATTAQVQALVGYGANATYNVDTYINIYVDMAEGIICSATRFNWCDKYPTLNSDVKGSVSMCAASYAAMCVIQADMKGFINRQEAETRLNFLRDVFVRHLEILKELNVQDFMKKA